MPTRTSATRAHGRRRSGCGCRASRFLRVWRTAFANGSGAVTARNPVGRSVIEGHRVEHDGAVDAVLRVQIERLEETEVDPVVE